MQRIIISGNDYRLLEFYFNSQPGIFQTTVGYINEDIKYPKEGDQVSIVAVEIFYDEKTISLPQIIKLISEYQSINQEEITIYYSTDNIKNLLTKALDEISNTSLSLEQEKTFYVAEMEFQNYFERHSSQHQ